MAAIHRKKDKQRLCKFSFFGGGKGGGRGGEGNKVHYVKCRSGEYDFTFEF